MTLVGAQAAHPTPPIAAMVIAALLVLAMLLPAGLAARSVWLARRTLRSCPRCGARAVRQAAWEQLSPRLERIALQCGQCATWRRVVVEADDRRAQMRRLERDRRRLARRVRRLEAARGAAERRAFTRPHTPSQIDRSGIDGAS